MMDFQEWYEKNEKELYEEFAKAEGQNFNFFCDNEFRTRLDT